MTEGGIKAACPWCGAELVSRINGESGEEFFACPRWAERKPDGERRCTYTRELPEYVRMQRAGANPLPGFE